MKQNLTNLGQKLTNLFNLKLQETSLSKEEYILFLERIEIIIEKELKGIKGEIIIGEIVKKETN